MPETQKTYQQSKLLNRYYDKIGRAAVGQGACPHFIEFRAGFGLLDECDPGDPKLLPIPPDMTEIPREFYRGLIEAEYSNGTILCKCEIPLGTVSEPTRYNMIGIYDQDTELIAVCTMLPDWVTPTEMNRAYPAVIFPIETVGGDNA